MKLRKATRKRIYEAAAKHESLTIAWPPSAPEPLPGHKYSVKGFDSETRLVVEKRKPKGERWEAVVRLDHDPIRMLFGLSATRNDAGDLETEPEPVPRPWQQRRSMEGSQKTARMGEERRREGKRSEHLTVVAREYAKGNDSGARAAQRRADRAA